MTVNIEDVNGKARITFDSNNFNSCYHALKNFPSNTRKYNPIEKAWYLIPELVSNFCKQVGINTPEKYKKENVNDIENGLVIEIKDNKFELSSFIPVRDSRLSRMLFINDSNVNTRPRDAFHIKDILEPLGYKVEIKGFKPNIGLKMPRGPKLYDFQKEALDFLLKYKRGIVAFDMGLGKTIIALEYVRQMKFRSACVLASSVPMQIQWKNELEKHFGCNQAVIINGKIPKKKRLPLYNSPFVIASYDIWKADLKDIEKNPDIHIHYDTLIMDECQKVKNWDTQRAFAVSKIVAPYVIGLSGTPVESKLRELYFIADQIVPGYFGSYSQFKSKYYVTDYFGAIIDYKNLEDVFDALKTFMIRHVQDEVLDQLPKVVPMEIRVDLTKEEKKLFEKIIDDGKSIGNLMNLKVASSNMFMRGLESSKMSSKEKALKDLLNDELLNKKVIIFTQYTKNIPRILNLLGDREKYYLQGGMKFDPVEISEKIEKSKNAVLVMSEVGVYGLNLQSANVVLNFDLPWNPTNLKQRLGRIRRLESDYDSVLEINMISNDSLDDYIINLLEDKKYLFDVTIEGKPEKKIKKEIMNMIWD